MRADVQIEPDGEQTKAFRWGTDGALASSDEIQQDARVLAELSADGRVSENQVRSAAPAAWIETNWSHLQPRLAPTERVRRQTFWMLEVPSIELTYALGDGSAAVVSFEGRRMLAPPSSIDTLFTKRAVRIRYARSFGLAFAVLLPAIYLLRGRYFWNGWLLAMATASVAGAFALYGFVRESTLGRTKARRWATSCAVATLTICGVAFGAEPSLRAAQHLLSSGELAKARSELVALGRRDDAAVSDTWADLSLAEARRTDDPASAAKQAALIPSRLPQRLTADRRAFELASRVASAHLSQKDAASAKAALEGILPVLRTGPPDSDLDRGIGELTAQIHDQEYDDCKTDECRWQASAAALGAAASETRAARARKARTSVLAVLKMQPSPTAAPLERLRAFDSTLQVATFVQRGSPDPELAADSASAIAYADGQRSKIALLGAEQSVAAELLRAALVPGASTLGKVESSVGVYCSIRGGRCAGVYIVGTEKTGRVLNDERHATVATKSLSQAVGAKVSLPDPPHQSTTDSPMQTRWRVNGIGVLARWRDSQLIELRIGDVSP